VDDQPSDAAHTPEEIKVQSVWIGVRHNFGSDWVWSLSSCRSPKFYCHPR